MLFGIVCEASRTCPWHCLRGAHVQPVGPGLLASSCNSALSARHLVHALGTVYEAPTFSQWVPAFSLPHALALSARHLVHALGTVYEAPTFSQWVPAFSLPHALRHCLQGISHMPFGTVYEAPTFSQWVPAFSLPHALRHCLQGIPHMPLALSTRRPRSASGSRPSRFLMHFGIVCEASRTCPWHCLRGAHVQPVGPGFSLQPQRAFSLPQHIRTVYEAVKTTFMLSRTLAIPLLESFITLRQATKLNHAYRISVCSVKKARLASSLSLVAGVHIRIVRRNPPVTDDHNLSNPSERYRTRLGDNELGF